MNSGSVLANGEQGFPKVPTCAWPNDNPQACMSSVFCVMFLDCDVLSGVIDKRDHVEDTCIDDWVSIIASQQHMSAFPCYVACSLLIAYYASHIPSLVVACVSVPCW